MSSGKERSRESWQRILDKRKATTAARREDKEQDALAEVLKNEPKPEVKSVATCGQERCCGRGGPEITYDMPSVMSGGLSTGPFTFGGKITPPMACAGERWIPRKKSDYERRREERKNAPASGLDEFKKR